MRAVRASVRLQHIGQICAFLTVAGGVIATVYLAMHGHDTVAAVLGGATLTTIVVAFLQSKKSKSE